LRDIRVSRLIEGAIPGIAVTEPHGGSQVHATRTRAMSSRDGTWTVTGLKTWISRLTEAAIFCLFFAGPDGEISVAAVDAHAEGLTRVPLTPAGLSGWTWENSTSAKYGSARTRSSGSRERGCGRCGSISPGTGRWSPPPRSGL